MQKIFKNVMTLMLINDMFVIINCYLKQKWIMQTIKDKQVKFGLFSDRWKI